MAIKMRILQTYDMASEREFLVLEKKFAALEKRCCEFPKGVRYKPIASALPTNTLIWECEFPTLDAAQQALKLFERDPQHEALARQQRKYFQSVRIEFLEKL